MRTRYRSALTLLLLGAAFAAPGQQPALRTKPDDVNVTWTTGVYAYDGAGDITSITRSDTTDTYHYDAFGRLHDATAYVGTQNNLQTFTYDPLGNLTRIDTDGAPRRYIPVNQATNRIELPQNPPTDGTVITAAYDAAGNQIALNGTYTYAYDGASMMTTATSAGHTDRYLYDADDQRVAAVSGGSTQRWRYTLRDLDAKFVREYVDDVAAGIHTWSWTKDYVYAGTRPVAAIATSGTTHFHVDHLGTIRLITDGEGHLLAKHTLRPFGEEAPGSDRDAELLKFTGHERDFGGGGDTDDLDYMHARHYSPLTGRFLSVDRHVGTSSEPQSWNRYAYARDNPIMRVDPNGLRDIYVLFWHAETPYLFGNGSVGHTAAFETNGRVILSQFPQKSGSSWPNYRLDYQATLKEEKKAPDSAFKIFVPDDKKFDAEAVAEAKAKNWVTLPRKGESTTNCVTAVSRSLNAGGLPIDEPDMRPGYPVTPGDLEDRLGELMKSKANGRSWSVQQVSPTVLGAPPTNNDLGFFWLNGLPGGLP